MIVVFWPLDSSGREDRNQPPFAEEMESIPRPGEHVAFFKTETRHPVMDVREGARDYGYRVSWKVTSEPLHVPDLGAVIVRVECESARWMTDTTLGALAQALDLDPPPAKVIPEDDDPNLPAFSLVGSGKDMRIVIQSVGWTVDQDWFDGLRKRMPSVVEEAIQKTGPLGRSRPERVRVFNNFILTWVCARLREGLEAGYVQRGKGEQP